MHVKSAYNLCNAGEPSLLFRLDKPGILKPPDGFRVASTTSDSVTFEWKLADSWPPATGYKLQIRDRDVPDDTQGTEIDLPANTTKYTVEEISVNTNYTFNIIAVNQLGLGKPAECKYTTIVIY